MSRLSARRLLLVAAVSAAAFTPLAFALEARPTDHATQTGHTGHAGHAGAPSPGAVDPAQAQGLDTEPSPPDTHTGRHESHGDDAFLWLRADRLEAIDAGGGAAQAWRGSASWGNSLDRVWLASEGERQDGKAQDLETQVLVTHAVAPFWNAAGGLRVTRAAGTAQTWAGIGVQGLAPYWFETSVMLYAGEGGQTALRVDVDHELLLGNRLILQPALELKAYGREDAPHGQGAGLADSRAGLRLRYEVTRKFAPYVGIEWSQAWGETRDLLSAAGARVHDAEAVAGLRLWY